MQTQEWYYAIEGVQHGPVGQEDLVHLLQRGRVTGTDLVWTAAMANWQPVVSTTLTAYLTAQPNSPPPPLNAERVRVGNEVVWVLAFVPLIATLLELIIAAAAASDPLNLWYVTLGLNLVLSVVDMDKLTRAGYPKLSWAAVFLVPVYLWKRAELVGERPTYLQVWCAQFGLLLLFWW